MFFMIIIFFRIIFIYFVFLMLGFTVTDDAGQVLVSRKPFKRIVSLAPHITETLTAIQADAEIVGVIRGDKNKSVTNCVQVGTYSGLDVEKIISLKPDLIITWNKMFYRELVLLKKMGAPYYVSNPKSLKDISTTILNFGTLTGHEKIAHEKAYEFQKELARISKRYQNKSQVTVFYQIGSYGLLTINKTSWISEAIKRCGGRNIFDENSLLVKEISLEALYQMNPDVILTDSSQSNWKYHWQKHFPYLKAVKRQKLYKIQADLIDQASPKLLKGLNFICQYLEQARN